MCRWHPHRQNISTYLANVVRRSVVCSFDGWREERTNLLKGKTKNKLERLDASYVYTHWMNESFGIFVLCLPLANHLFAMRATSPIRRRICIIIIIIYNTIRCAGRDFCFLTPPFMYIRSHLTSCKQKKTKWIYWNDDLCPFCIFCVCYENQEIAPKTNEIRFNAIPNHMQTRRNDKTERWRKEVNKKVEKTSNAK